MQKRPEFIETELSYKGGSSDRLTGTTEHPFQEPAAGNYVPWGEMEVGTVLRVHWGGGRNAGQVYELADVDVDGLLEVCIANTML